MAQKGRFKLTDAAVSELERLVRNAVRECREAAVHTERVIADIYAGRDWTSSIEGYIPDQGTPLREWAKSVRDGKQWQPPQTMANLLQSRLRMVTAALSPGVPTLHVKPQTLGSAKLAQHQEALFNVVMRHAGMEDAMRDYAQSGMMTPYAGVRVWFDQNDSIPFYERFQTERVSCRDCGWEPFLRRFRYHRYQRSFEELPKAHQTELKRIAKRDGSEEVQPWTVIDVLEVYHEGFRAGHTGLKGVGMCPRSTWLSKTGSSFYDSSRKGDEDVILGEYVGTTMVKRCPIAIASFLEPADQEDVPPSEVSSWLPPLRGLVQTLIQINREVTTSNNIILYDDNIEEEHIDAAQDAPSSARIFIPIATDEKGVAQKMRPMEKENLINELLVAHNVFMNMFDQVVGVTPTGMGIAEHPRKSATEAGAIDRNGNIRNQDRLKIVAQVWQEVANIIFANQRDVLGEKIEVLLNNDVAVVIEVPSQSDAELAFRVDPIELGHLSKQDEADQLLGWVTIFSNAFLQFRGAIPRIVRESLRRVAHLMGIENVDAYLEQPVIEQGPEDRYIKALETGEDIAVNPDDDHALFLSYYSGVLDRALASDNPLVARVSALKDAIEKHQQFLDVAQRGNNFAQGPGNAPSIIPGQDPNAQQQIPGLGEDSTFPIAPTDVI